MGRLDAVADACDEAALVPSGATSRSSLCQESNKTDQNRSKKGDALRKAWCQPCIGVALTHAGPSLSEELLGKSCLQWSISRHKTLTRIVQELFKSFKTISRLLKKLKKALLLHSLHSKCLLQGTTSSQLLVFARQLCSSGIPEQHGLRPIFDFQGRHPVISCSQDISEALTPFQNPYADSKMYNWLGPSARRNQHPNPCFSTCMCPQ